MSELKFTRGPWRLDDYGDGRLVVRGMTSGLRNHVPDEQERVICEVNNSILQAAANATLIEAAPRMFKVLEEVKRLIDEYLDGTYETLAVGLTQQQKMNLIDTVSRYKFSIARDMINAVLLTIVE